MTTPGDRPPPGGPRPPLPPGLDPRAGRVPHGGQPAPGRSSGRPGAGRRPGTRRTPAVWVVRGVAAALSFALLMASGWGWYLGQVASATVNRTDAIPSTGNEDTVGAGEAMNLLLVGNDSRSDLTDAQLAELNAGTDSGTNTDTMILVHVPADGSAASFVSFPRDSYVDIPGHGKDKLNAAYAYGTQDVADDATAAQKSAAGAQLLVQTISQLSGLQIDHYAEVDLLGFFNLATVVGGVEVNLCAAVDDSAYSGAVFPAGVQTISGADALKFVRQRHGLPRGDFDRIVRQQVFIAGVLRKMLSQDVLLDLGKQRALVKATADSLTVDEDLDLLQLAQQMQSVTPGSIDFQTIPFVGTATDDQGRSIVQLADSDTLHTFFAGLSGGGEEEPAAAAETLAPSAVTVEVFNGSGTGGLAATTASQLEAAGFQVAGTGNADASDYTTTDIRYAAGDESLAATLAAQVPGATTTESTDPPSGTVQLVLGSDFTAIGQAVAAPTAAAGGDAARTAADTTCIN